ncbi:hypothetical protein KIPB_008392, partial [Kipferlia bialata]
SQQLDLQHHAPLSHVLRCLQGEREREGEKEREGEGDCIPLPLSVPGAALLSALRLTVKVRALTDDSLIRMVKPSADRVLCLSTDRANPGADQDKDQGPRSRGLLAELEKGDRVQREREKDVERAMSSLSVLPPIPTSTPAYTPVPYALHRPLPTFTLPLSRQDTLFSLGVTVQRLLGDAGSTPALEHVPPDNDLAQSPTAVRADTFPSDASPILFFDRTDSAKGADGQTNYHNTQAQYGLVPLLDKGQSMSNAGTYLPTQLGQLASGTELTVYYRRMLVPPVLFSSLRAVRVVWFGTDPLPIKDIYVLVPRNRGSATLGYLHEQLVSRLVAEGQITPGRGDSLGLYWAKTDGHILAQFPLVKNRDSLLIQLLPHPAPENEFLRASIPVSEGSSTRDTYTRDTYSQRERESTQRGELLPVHQCRVNGRTRPSLEGASVSLFGHPLLLRVGKAETVSQVMSRICHMYENARERRRPRTGISEGEREWAGQLAVPGVGDQPLCPREPCAQAPLAIYELEYSRIDVPSRTSLSRAQIVVLSASGTVETVLDASVPIVDTFHSRSRSAGSILALVQHPDGSATRERDRTRGDLRDGDVFPVACLSAMQAEKPAKSGGRLQLGR